MALFGEHWKDEPIDDSPLIRKWTEESDNPHDIPTPSVYQLLDQMTDVQRLEVFHHYCKHCGSKDKTCQCWKDE